MKKRNQETWNRMRDVGDARLPTSFQHPDDICQNRAARNIRAQEKSWADKVCEPNRIYDALTRDAGYNHNYHAPQAPAIVYDGINGKWIEAGDVTQLSNSTKLATARQIKADTQRVIKSYVSNTDW